jgi:hypothetical protein
MKIQDFQKKKKNCVAPPGDNSAKKNGTSRRAIRDLPSKKKSKKISAHFETRFTAFPSPLSASAMSVKLLRSTCRSRSGIMELLLRLLGRKCAVFYGASNGGEMEAIGWVLSEIWCGLCNFWWFLVVFSVHFRGFKFEKEGSHDKFYSNRTAMKRRFDWWWKRQFSMAGCRVVCYFDWSE